MVCLLLIHWALVCGLIQLHWCFRLLPFLLFCFGNKFDARLPGQEINDLPGKSFLHRLSSELIECALKFFIVRNLLYRYIIPGNQLCQIGCSFFLADRHVLGPDDGSED